MSERPAGPSGTRTVAASEPDPLVEELVARALAAQARAYAPYSRYPVGCALLAGGQVYEGANVENASYGLTLCAERVATATAAAAGERAIDRIAVATPSSPPVPPCGMCLQTLIEFTDDPGALRIVLVNASGERREVTLAELFPHGFTRGQLRAAVPDPDADPPTD